uniref:Uncharacterized protein n=1 Tax=Panagrolaimus davidi TaxID=227884 RepID=A0A914QHX0_9BILA
MIQTSGRLFRDVMEMFVPSQSGEGRRPSRETSDSSSFISSLLPPFGINRQVPVDGSTASGLTSSSASLVPSVTNLFKPNSNRQEDIEPNHPLMPIGSTNNMRPTNNAGQQWSSIAKDVMGLFVASPATTTTTLPPPILGLDMLNPRFIQQV